MLLGLYTSVSLFSQDCFKFSKYFLQDDIKTAESTPKKYAYVNFNASGPRFNSSFGLEQSFWKANGISILADTCSSQVIFSYENTNIFGILGMGFSGISINNYALDKRNFSIFIAEDGSSGQLLSTIDVDYATTSDPVAILSASSNLHAYGLSDISISSSDKSKEAANLTIDAGIPYNVIFDLNSDAIGVPSALYSQLIIALQQQAMTLRCSADLYLPRCDYTGSIEDLPIINFTVGSGTFSIGPKIYILNSTKNTGNTTRATVIILNIKTTSDQQNDANYVNSVYRNSIILDSAFMSYYYTGFSWDTQNEKVDVKLYVADHTSINDDPNKVNNQSHGYHYAIITVILVLLIAALAYHFFVRRRKIRASDLEGIQGRGLSLSDYGKERGVSLLRQSQL